AGLVRLATVKSQQLVAARRAPLEVTTQAMPEDKTGHFSSAAIKVLKKTTQAFMPHVLALGPGLGQTAAVTSLVRQTATRINIPLVLDADGLNVSASSSFLARHKAPLIITPHPGEMSRLLHWTVTRVQAHRMEAALMAARKFQCVCLLKGAGTLITDG